LALPIKAAHPRDYHSIARASEAVVLLCRAGFVCPVVTVQSRIEKGLYSEHEFRGWFRSFSAQFAALGGCLEGPYICPHRFSTPCACKKAGGLLYQRAAAELNIDVASSFVVGDTFEDMTAAQTIGCPGVLVRTGWQVAPQTEAACEYVADDLLGAARWITDADA
jgi:D-glycero-D-manno-heptose 1,7-bisphosphate phosphatase